MRKLMVALLALLMIFQLGAVSVFAAEGTGYTYTVRIYAGNQGSIDGGKSVIEIEGVPYNGTVDFDLDRVNLNSDRYYVQGIRYAGRDNTALQSTHISVTGDVDYVVAYGIRGTLVQYTVNYQTANGTTLAPSQTYYGNSGDKPVVAFLYIDGYMPQAYNLTRTLSTNAAENVFTFVYTPLVTVVTQNQTAVTPAPAEETGADAGTEGEAGEAGEAPVAGEAGEAGETEEPAVEEEEQPEAEQPEVEEPEDELTTIDEDQVPQDNTPQELIDLDEDETPLGSGPVADDAQRFGFWRLLGSVGILCGSLVGLLLIVLFVTKNRKKTEGEA